jgi:hypothetical protein
MRPIDIFSRTLAAALFALLYACGGSDPGVGSQDITFAIDIDPQPQLAQGGRSAAAVRVLDADPGDDSPDRNSPDEREAFSAAVTLRMVAPMPPGVAAEFAPATLHVGDLGSLEVRSAPDAQAGQHQVVVAGTIAGGSSTTRYVAHVVQVEARCAAGSEAIVEVFPSHMARTIALTASGAVYLWGHNANAHPQDPALPPPVPRALSFFTAQHIAELPPVRSAASGGGVSAFVLRDGGALRVLSKHYRSDVGAPGGHAGWFVYAVPDPAGFVQVVAAQEPVFFALRDDGTVWQFVSSVAEDGDFHFTPAMQLQGFADVVQLAAGTDHLLALRRDGSVLAKGGNDHGQIGDGSGAVAYEPIVVPGLTDITRIAAGDEHSLALRANGTVLAWGRGDNGQIGDGFQVDAPRPLEVISAGGSPFTFIIDVAAGRAHSVLLRDDGLMLTWGRGIEGQLGHGAEQSLHPTPVDAGNAARVFAAADSTLRVEFGSGTVQGWGDNTEGQLGDGTARQRRQPVATLGLGHEGQQCRDDVVTPGG